MPGQFVPNPKNRTLRRGGSRVSRTGREESGPLSGPRQIAVRAMYRIPPRTSSAPSTIRNILASQFIAAKRTEPGIKRWVVRFVPGTEGRTDLQMRGTRSPQPLHKPKRPNCNEGQRENPSACQESRSITRGHDILRLRLIVHCVSAGARTLACSSASSFSTARRFVGSVVSARTLR